MKAKTIIPSWLALVIFGMKRRIILSALILLAISIANSGISLGAPHDIIGTWTVVSQIVTRCCDAPTMPQPGDIMPPVTWVITDTTNGPALNSYNGSVYTFHILKVELAEESYDPPLKSVYRQYTGNGAMFEFTTPILLIGTTYMYCLTHIECYSDSPTSMHGILENHYRTNNTMTGATTETSLDSFKFTATK